jgi:hypothetical protein
MNFGEYFTAVSQQLPAASFQLPVSSCQLPVSSFPFRLGAESCELRPDTLPADQNWQSGDRKLGTGN